MCLCWCREGRMRRCHCQVCRSIDQTRSTDRCWQHEDTLNMRLLGTRMEMHSSLKAQLARTLTTKRKVRVHSIQGCCMCSLKIYEFVTSICQSCYNGICFIFLETITCTNKHPHFRKSQLKTKFLVQCHTWIFPHLTTLPNDFRGEKRSSIIHTHTKTWV